MKHTMSMYASKDQMIEAMQTEIDKLEAELDDLRKDKARLDFIYETGATVSRRRVGIPFQIETYRCAIPPLCFEANTLREAIDNAMRGEK